VPTLLVTWVAFGQVVSLSGLAIWVVGGSLLGALVVSSFAGAGRRGLAVVTMVLLTGGVAFLARTVGGDSAGPITRASLMATGVAGAMGLILQTRYPAAVLAAALVLLGGATGLGAAGRAPWLIGAWAVAAAATLAMLGPYSRADLRARRRLVPLVVCLVAAGLAAVVVIGAATPALRSPWTIPGAADVTGEDQTSPPPPPTTAPPPSAVPTSPPPTTAPLPSAVPTPPSTVDPVDRDTVDATSIVVVSALLLVLLVLVLVAVAVLRRVLAWGRWRRLRRRLGTGSPRDRVVGAWTWVRLRRVRYDEPLPVSASPDVASTARSPYADRALQDVAQRAARVAYDSASAPSDADAEAAWSAALVAGSAPDGAGARSRWRWAARPPVRDAASDRRSR
jgi:hypothetical protein